MTDFDPKHLGEYIPLGMMTVRDLALLIAKERKIGRLLAWADCAKYNIYSDPEIVEIRHLIEWDRTQPLILTRFVWGELRESLVDEVVKLIAVGQDGLKREIDGAFWASDAGPHVMSCEYIDIPMYQPKGRVYFRKEDIDDICDHHRRISYNDFNDEEEFKYMPALDYKEYLNKARKSESDIGQSLLSLDPMSRKIKTTRGRKPTFDLRIFWDCVQEVREKGSGPIEKRGAKKAFLRLVREAYIEKREIDDLPSDDALMERISTLWKGEGRDEIPPQSKSWLIAG